MTYVLYLMDRVRALLTREEGQDGVEYMLIIGVVVIAVVGALATGVAGAGFGDIVDSACDLVAADLGGSCGT